jgi:methyl-accepting chemotaxis protein
VSGRASRPDLEPEIAQKHRSVKHYLLNPAFQLKYTAYLVVVVAIVMAGAGVVIFRIASASAMHAAFAAEEAEKALTESQTSSHLVYMQTVAEAGGESSPAAEILKEELAKKDAEVAHNLEHVKERKAAVAAGQTRLGELLAATGLALVVVLVVMGVFITHRIVGPVFKLKRLLRQVATGRLSVKERLRKGDELGDLFDTFLQMTLSLKVRELDRMATLDQTIEGAAADGASPAVIARLKTLKAQMRHW